jgi:hypothetical protein
MYLAIQKYRFWYQKFAIGHAYVADAGYIGYSVNVYRTKKF